MPHSPVVWRDRLTFRDYLLALVAGGAFAVAVLCFGVPGLDPALWEETAVAAGVRPPQAIFPGLWRLLTFWMFPLFGMKGAIHALSFVGAVAGGVSIALVALCVRQLLMFLLRTGEAYDAWTNRIAPYFAFVAAALLGMSDPMWRLANTFSPDGLRFLMTLAAAHVLLRWLNVGGLWRLFPAFALLGVLAAETPFGFALPILFVFGYYVVLHGVMDGIYAGDAGFPEPREMPRWRTLFSFLGGFAVAVWLNVQVFVALGGLEATGWNLADIYFHYLAGYGNALTGASSIAGWGLGIGFGVLPLVATVCLFPLIAHDDRPMPFHFGMILFLAGFLGLLQTGAFPAARFWTFMHDFVMVPSGYLLTLFVLFSVTSVALMGAGFAQECQRCYLVEGEAPPPGVALRGFVAVIAALLMVLAAVHVPRPTEIEMQRIVADALDETVRECAGLKWLFTDGRLDAGVELAAVQAKSPLRTFNMMSGATPWEKYLRTRNFEKDTPDWNEAEKGVPSLLRVWAGEKKDGMDEAGIQLGFDFWRREKRPLPPQSGFVAREKGLDDAEAKRGVAVAEALAKRILDITPAMEKAAPSPALASALSAVSWRIARFARLRNEESLADNLDKANSVLKKMLDTIERERMRTFMQLTPREGLQLALRRSDFVQARTYALAVLRFAPNDADANFGMGMAYLLEGNDAEAEKYLMNFLKARPGEPSVLNNLAIVYRRTKREQKAVEYAKEALRLLQDRPEEEKTRTAIAEVKKTLAAAEEALAKAKAAEAEKAAQKARKAARKVQP